MNASIFLTLLCLGIASVAPKVDNSLDDQSNLFEATVEEVSDMVKDLINVINDVLVEESPKVLDTHSQEESEEQQSNRTASNHSGDISLLIKSPKKTLGKSKGTTRNGKLVKIAKVLGKKLVSEILNKAPKLKEVGKRIGEHILGDVEISESLGEVFKVIEESVLGDNNPPVTPEDSDFGDETNEES